MHIYVGCTFQEPQFQQAPITTTGRKRICACVEVIISDGAVAKLQKIPKPAACKTHQNKNDYKKIIENNISEDDESEKELFKAKIKISRKRRRKRDLYLNKTVVMPQYWPVAEDKSVVSQDEKIMYVFSPTYNIVKVMYFLLQILIFAVSIKDNYLLLPLQICLYSNIKIVPLTPHQ